jgi:hypothetical protein
MKAGKKDKQEKKTSIPPAEQPDAIDKPEAKVLPDTIAQRAFIFAKRVHPMAKKGLPPLRWGNF